MTTWRNSLLAAGLSLPLGLFPAMADDVTLTPEQMVLATRQALAARQPGFALALTRAYLSVTPDAVPMLVLRSRAQRDLGQYKAARTTAKQAWAQSGTDTEKFAAAIAVAQAASSDGNKMAGQIWLRRASNHASTPAQKQQLRRDFAYVRARNPWRLQLDFGLTPSSNINDGTSEDSAPGTFGGLKGVYFFPPSAKALSGLEGHLALNLSYRIAEGPRSRSWIGFQAYHKEVWLSDESKTAAPTVTAGTFRYSSVALTYRHQRLLGAERGLLDANLRLGRNWYGGDPLSTFVGAGLQLHLPPSKGKRLSFRARYDLQAPDAAQVENIHVAQIDLRYRLPWQGNRVTLSADYQKSLSENQNLEYDELRASVELDLAKEINGMSFSLGVSGRTRHYDTSNFATGGRTDNSFEAFSSVTFNKITYMGFAPALTLRHERTSSNVARFTKSETTLGLSIRSTF